MGQSGWGLLLCLLLAACAPPPVRALPAPAASATPSATLAAALAAADPAPLVAAERDAAAARDLATLALLWADDGRVVEARGAAGAADDYTWQGRKALLDRYTVAVFPSPPPPMPQPFTLRAAVTGASATLHNGVDTWRFVRRDGRWWIQELVIGQ